MFSGISVYELRRRWAGGRILVALFLAFLGMVLLSTTVLAATSGPNVPTATVAPNQFINATNAYADDNLNYATGTDGQQQGYKTFGFSLPSATIQGIEVKLNGNQGACAKNTRAFKVKLSQNGGTSFTGNVKATNNYGSTDSTETLGGASDLWGSSWTSTQINNTLALYVEASCSGGSATAGALKLDQITVTVYYTPSDTTSPLITPTISPLPNAAGWNNSNPTVTWSVSDPDSGIATSTGCGSTTISTDTTGQQVTCSATNGSGLSNSQSVTIKLDKTAPNAPTASVNPPPNSAGWNNTTPVTVSFTSNGDAGTVQSGVANCTNATNLISETTGTVVNGTCTDVAGNSSAPASTTVKIDKTKPTIAGSPSPAANSAGWNNTSVTLNFTCTDGTSGVASGSPTNANNTFGEGAGQSVSSTCTDNAGNTITSTVSNINVDLTAPTIIGTRDTPANSNNWNNTNVAVHFDCTEALSGISTITASGAASSSSTASPLSVTITSEGANQTETGNCKDKADNLANPVATISDINIDKTAPSITATSNPAANGNGWNNTDVAIDFGCTDALSNIDSIMASGVVNGSATTSPLSVTVNSEGANQAESGKCTDKAGNEKSANLTLNIDKTPPSVALTKLTGPTCVGGNEANDQTCTGTLYTNASVHSEATGSDALSGLDSLCNTLTIQPAGTQLAYVADPNCTATTCYDFNSGTDVSKDGPFGIELGACDLAGNTNVAGLQLMRDVTVPKIDPFVMDHQEYTVGDPIVLIATAKDEVPADHAGNLCPPDSTSCATPSGIKGVGGKVNGLPSTGNGNFLNDYSLLEDNLDGTYRNPAVDSNSSPLFPAIQGDNNAEAKASDKVGNLSETASTQATGYDLTNLACSSVTATSGAKATLNAASLTDVTKSELISNEPVLLVITNSTGVVVYSTHGTTDADGQAIFTTSDPLFLALGTYTTTVIHEKTVASALSASWCSANLTVKPLASGGGFVLQGGHKIHVDFDNDLYASTQYGLDSTLQHSIDSATGITNAIIMDLASGERNVPGTLSYGGSLHAMDQDLAAKNSHVQTKLEQLQFTANSSTKSVSIVGKCRTKQKQGPWSAAADCSATVTDNNEPGGRHALDQSQKPGLADQVQFGIIGLPELTELEQGNYKVNL